MGFWKVISFRFVVPMICLATASPPPGRRPPRGSMGSQRTAQRPRDPDFSTAHFRQAQKRFRRQLINVVIKKIDYDVGFKQKIVFYEIKISNLSPQLCSVTQFQAKW